MLCIVAVALVVFVALWRTHAPPVVVVPRDDAAECAAMLALSATALYDRLPPVDASADVVAAVATINAEMTQVRYQIEEACRG